MCVKQQLVEKEDKKLLWHYPPSMQMSVETINGSQKV